MADKSLSQVIGAGGREIGDVIKTKATALTDGKVLLPLDGSTITPASYPLLEALLPDTVGMGVFDSYISSDDTSFDDNTDVIDGDKLYINDAGTIVMATDDSAGMWFQDAAGAALLVSYGIGNSDASKPVGSSDGVELGYALIGGGTSTNDLEWWYSTDSGATAFTKVTLESSDAMDGTVVTFMNRAGTAAKVVAQNTTDAALETYGSGADITTGWSLDFAPTYSASPPVEPSNSASSDDFATMVLVDYAVGMWISRNSGSSWSENVLLPNQTAADHVAVTDADVIFALNRASYGAEKIFKSTSGVTFTEVLTNQEAAAALNLSSNVDHVVFLDVWTDGTNIFVLGSATNGAPGATTTSFIFQDRPVIFYSDDAGVTWSGDVVGNGQTRSTGSNNTFFGYEIAAQGHKFKMSPGCTVMAWISAASTVSGSLFADVTAPGKILPIVPGYKIVADAP